MSTNPRRLNKYELQTRLGHGGMAEVWKALDTQLQRYVAIKILHADLQNDPNFVTRFEREAQFIASLHHPNIVQIFDFHVSHPPETEDTVAYMVMDYVEGQTLSRYLHETSHAGKFPSSSDLVQLFTPICLAIDYAHQKGMLHRDIKPSNILLDRRGTLKNPLGEPVLSDFGIAKLLGAAAITSSGWWLGTPSYTSPEIAMGKPGDERSDIYSLSVILYEACAGALPFQGDNPTAVLMQHAHAAPIPPALINPAISPALAAVILRGLAKEPEQRFPSASSLGIALAEALHMPVDDRLRQVAYLQSEMNGPTYISSAHPWSALPPGPSAHTPAISTPQAEPVAADASAASAYASSAHITPANFGAGARPTPTPIPDSTPAPVAFSPATPAPPALVAAPVQQQPAPPPATPRRGRKGRIITTIILALALVVGSMSALVLLARRPAPPPSTANQVVGYAFFLNSGQLNPDNSQGINDEVLIQLHNIPDPPAGKTYYAWLLSDSMLSEQTTTGLGPLTINHGQVRLLYKGNQRHANLLAFQSRILITEEDSSTSPAMYTPDTAQWKYYAKLSQAVSPQDRLHFSMLDHLRHLLSESPELKLRGLHGGLDMWFLRNTQKILEWSTAARDDWRTGPDLLHRQVVRILDYLDGASYVQKDAPAAGPVVLADQHDSQVGLLGQAPTSQDPPGYVYDDEAPPGYVYLVSSHLAGTVLSPDATPDQRTLSARIHLAIDQVKGWLQQLHQDAKQLVTMNANQLAQPATLSILDDMVTQAQHAYNGETDPLTGQLTGGAIWICSNIQRMATFELKPFTAL